MREIEFLLEVAQSGKERVVRSVGDQRLTLDVVSAVVLADGLPEQFDLSLGFDLREILDRGAKSVGGSRRYGLSSSASSSGTGILARGLPFAPVNGTDWAVIVLFRCSRVDDRGRSVPVIGWIRNAGRSSALRLREKTTPPPALFRKFVQKAD